MSASKDHDTNLPILVLIRRGRRGRGYLVAAADDPNDFAPCADAEEMGQAIVELLEDPEQARFDPTQVDAAPQDADPAGDKQETYAPGAELEGYGEDDEEEEEDEEPGFFEVDPTKDVADQLLFKLGSAVLKKGQQLSNSYRKKGPRGPRR